MSSHSSPIKVKTDSSTADKCWPAATDSQAAHNTGLSGLGLTGLGQKGGLSLCDKSLLVEAEGQTKAPA